MLNSRRGKNTRSCAGVENGVSLFLLVKLYHIRHKTRSVLFGEKSAESDVFGFRFFSYKLTRVSYGKIKHGTRPFIDFPQGARILAKQKPFTLKSGRTENPLENKGFFILPRIILYYCSIFSLLFQVILEIFLKKCCKRQILMIYLV